MSHPIDVHVGSRMKLRRQLLGLRQSELAEALGLSFQQVQKYEKGSNRIGASRLLQIASILNVPISFFFEELPDEIGGMGESQSVALEFRPETVAFVRAYTKIKRPALRRSVYNLVKELAGKVH